MINQIYFEEWFFLFFIVVFNQSYFEEQQEQERVILSELKEGLATVQIIGAEDEMNNSIQVCINVIVLFYFKLRIFVLIFIFCYRH